MIPFAVTVEGLTAEGEAWWVLAVDGERLLVCDTGHLFQWVSLAQCKFAKLVNPELPIAVAPMQPTPHGWVPTLRTDPQPFAEGSSNSVD